VSRDDYSSKARRRLTKRSEETLREAHSGVEMEKTHKCITL
jgi:hypothetical protein